MVLNKAGLLDPRSKALPFLSYEDRQNNSIICGSRGCETGTKQQGNTGSTVSVSPKPMQTNDSS